MVTITYHKNLNSNPHFSLRNFAPHIKRAIKEGEEMYYTQPLELGGVGYTISFEPKEMIVKIGWTEEGEKYEYKVKVLQERSNLPSLSGSMVYYFICPRTGQKARVIYRVGNYFWSRRALDARYYLQTLSRHSRTISHREDPHRKNGKEYYRGNLTPYGKRLKKYYDHEEQVVEELSKFLSKSIYKKTCSINGVR